MDGVAIDGYISCTDENATAAARMLAMEEGIMAGYSTGAQLHAAIELMRDRLAGKTVAFLVCDSGMKYLSTQLYP
jgi:cysteine synthase A